MTNIEQRAIVGDSEALSSVPGERVTAELRAGDLTQWEQLFVRLETRCLALASRIVGDRHLAADAVQEAFLRTYRVHASLKPDCKVDRWLVTAVANAALDMLRTQRRTAKAVHAAAPRAVSSESNAQEHEEWLWHALAQLDEQSRLVFLLVHQEGLTYADVAAEFGWPVGTVRSKLHRTRHRLRELLTGGISHDELH